MPTRDQFEAYEATRKTGMFNMIMQAKDAAEFSGLTLEVYFSVQKKYGTLMKRYPEVRKLNA